MTRKELLEKSKPIFFNTEMVQAILEGRKTVTRRVAKTMRKESGTNEFYTPILVNDVLYVRETWLKDSYRYMYRANYANNEKFYRGGVEVKPNWKPSIHMPKEAARIFLKVTDVRIERLQDITEEQAIAEGIYPSNCRGCDSKMGCDTCPDEGYYEIDAFEYLWNSTIKKQDLDKYGWEANPWVWVIEFEKVEV